MRETKERSEREVTRRKTKMRKRYTERITVCLDTDTTNRLKSVLNNDIFCLRHNIKTSELIRHFVEKGLDEYQQTKRIQV